MGLAAEISVEATSPVFIRANAAARRERTAASDCVIERIRVKAERLQQPCVFMKGNGLLPSNAVDLGSRKTCDEERKPVHQRTFKL